jgi:hypothetical protein
MTTEIVTEPGSAVVMKQHTDNVRREQVHPATGTFTARFEVVKNLLSDKPLQRPARLRPLPHISNEMLRDAAKRYQPPVEWFEGEEDRPF